MLGRLWGGLFVKGECPMEHDMNAEALGASFDVIARQDAADQLLGALRSDVEEVKSRIDKVVRHTKADALAEPEEYDGKPTE